MYEITVHYLCGVDVLEASEELIEEKLIVFFGERLIAFDDGGKICIHHFRDNVTRG